MGRLSSFFMPIFCEFLKTWYATKEAIACHRPYNFAQFRVSSGYQEAETRLSARDEVEGATTSVLVGKEDSEGASGEPSNDWASIRR